MDMWKGKLRNKESPCSALIFLFIAQEEHSIPLDLHRAAFAAAVRPPDITYLKNDVSLSLSNLDLLLLLTMMGNRLG